MEQNGSAEKRPPERLLKDLYRQELGEILPENLHVVDHEMKIYRSGQPSRAEFLELEKHGFKSVLNLRCRHDDTELLIGIRLKEYNLKIYMINEDEMIQALKILKDAEKPVLFHCLLGCDRTGAVAVGCRVVFNGWSVEDAINEFNDEVFGSHRLLYFGYPALLRKLNWEAIKAAVL